MGRIRTRDWCYRAAHCLGQRLVAGGQAMVRGLASIRTAATLPIFTVLAVATMGQIRMRDWCCQTASFMGQHLAGAVRVMGRCLGSTQMEAVSARFTVSRVAATELTLKREWRWRA